MNIKNYKIIEGKIVEFSTSFGVGIGTWYNNEVKEGLQYGIEFDILPKLKFGNNAKIVSENTYSVKHDGKVNELRGVVDGVDEDGLIYFRLGIDCLIMVESAEETIKEGDWLSLTVNTEDLIITPYGSSIL